METARRYTGTQRDFTLAFSHQHTRTRTRTPKAAPPIPANNVRCKAEGPTHAHTRRLAFHIGHRQGRAATLQGNICSDTEQKAVERQRVEMPQSETQTKTHPRARTHTHTRARAHSTANPITPHCIRATKARGHQPKYAAITTTTTDLARGASRYPSSVPQSARARRSLSRRLYQD